MGLPLKLTNDEKVVIRLTLTNGTWKPSGADLKHPFVQRVLNSLKTPPK